MAMCGEMDSEGLVTITVVASNGERGDVDAAGGSGLRPGQNANGVRMPAIA